jgi:NAD(P)-dependent dehydrogenase (short-subunit alcohol dehydrogenase family)
MRQKTTLITGANRGLGFEAARLFLEHGYRVVFAGRSRGALEEARRRLDPVGTRTSTLKLNMASPGLLHRVPGQPEAAGIQLDVLGDNAGVFPRDGDPVDGLRHAVETNVTGAVALTLAGSSHWLNAPEPRVAMVSSGLGACGLCAGEGAPLPDSNFLAYQTSKAALDIATLPAGSRGGTFIGEDGPPAW